jgi:hypothetical protein
MPYIKHHENVKVVKLLELLAKQVTCTALCNHVNWQAGLILAIFAKLQESDY